MRGELTRALEEKFAAEWERRAALMSRDWWEHEAAEARAERDRAIAARERMREKLEAKEEAVKLACDECGRTYGSAEGRGNPHLCPECDEARRDALRDELRAQAVEVTALSQENAEYEAIIDRLARERDALSARCAAQREELARLNGQMRSKKQVPKKVKWPRHPDGKLVKLGYAERVSFTKLGYTVEWADGEGERHRYGEAVDR